MRRTPDEIAAKAREIYKLAKASKTPLTVLSSENTNLTRQSGWELEDVELVTAQVMEMLIQHGWNQRQNQSGG
jgi:hypothetical protein